MPKSAPKKMKMLLLWEILRQDADEKHPMPTTEICRRLQEVGIPCERKSVYADIDVLNDYGFVVKKTTVGKQNGYYVEDRKFNSAELKIIIDAMQAASFITPQKTQELSEKIADLGGSHRAEVIKGSLVHFNTRKHTNEEVYKTVDMLERALMAKTKAAFYYYDLDEKHKKVFRKDRELYIVDPIALVFLEDNYYLMTYSEKYRKVVTYRVDRMDNVTALPKAVCKAAKMPEKKIAQFVEQTFKMFGGESESVTLRFDESLIGVIYDKFGEDTRMERVDETTCSAKVTVQISPTFWGWVFQFNGELQIAEPQDMIDTYKSLLEAACE